MDTPIPGYVTLQDVARVAGVSHMTVSRVIRGVDGVAASTAAKVREAIRSTGYRPDPMMSALAAYRSPRVESNGRHMGLAFLDCDGSEFSKRVRDGVAQEAQQYGYSLESHQLTGSVKEARQLSRILYTRGIRGLFFGPTNTEHHFHGWNWSQFAAVSLGALAHKPGMHSVAMDYFDGAWRGYHMLREQGLQRIGMVILPESQIRTGYRWLGGASTAAASMGEQLWHYPGTLLTDNEYARWLRAHQIEGVLTIHPSTLDLTRKHVRQIWFLNDWSAESKQANAVLSIPPQSIGREGVRFIHHLLLRREYGLPAQPHTVTVRGVWQTRS